MIKNTFEIGTNGALIETKYRVCDCCHKPNPDLIAQHYNDENEFISIGNAQIDICPECFKKNTYINDYGFIFLKTFDEYTHELILYIKAPYDTNFNKVRCQEQIDMAFNPDYYRFLRWEQK